MKCQLKTVDPMTNEMAAPGGRGDTPVGRVGSVVQPPPFIVMHPSR